jgi:pimeloyl-ACP methyl ester carboxylesterase
LPVVLLHGFPFDHTIWRAQVEALSGSFRLITPDLRGQGQSPVTEDVYTMDLLARDVIGLLDDLGIARAVWAGHSLGGYITMAALRIAPDRIAGIALVATQHRADTEERRQGRIAAAEQARTPGPHPVPPAMVQAMFAPGYDLASPTGRQITDLMGRIAPLGIAGTQLGMAGRPDSTETLRAVRVPAVVIAGAKDQIVPLAVAQQMAQTVPQSRLVEIGGAGHLVMIEQPEATTAALREFLAGIA